MLQVLKEIEDPEKWDEVTKQIMANTVVLTDEFGKQYKTVKIGKMVLPSSGLTRKGGRKFRDISTTKFRDDDVMLLSLPKTGTHWVTNVLHFLLKTGPLSEETSIPPPLIDVYTDEEIEVLPGPRILSSHMLPKMLPPDALKKGRKKILLFRNPKDTAVSLYFHMRKSKLLSDGMDISWNCFIENWMKGLIAVFYFFDYYNEWEQYMSENKDLDIFILHFEDLKKDEVKELRKLQAYLGLNHNDGRLQEVLDKCSINSLRADVENKKVVTPLLDDNGQQFLYRKGTVGDWKNHFTVAQNEQMEAICAEMFTNSIFKWQTYL